VNLTLATLAVLTTTPALRGRLALGAEPGPTARSAAAATLALLALVTVLAGPALAAAADVAAPTARIAAGLVMAITSIPDLWRRPVVAAPSDPPWRAGVVPVGFPELFGPALAAALTTATIDRGLAVAVALTAAAVLAVVVADRLPGGRDVTRPWRAALGVRAASAIAVGIAVVMNGVYDI
jgi:hypothetical protein